MLYVLINGGAVVAGSLLGLFLKKVLGEKLKQAVNAAMGLAVLSIGVMDVIKTPNALVLILSLAVGAGVGAALGISRGLDRLGASLESGFGKSGGSFAKGFSSATVLVCVGAMALYGSVEAGLGRGNTLLVKSILDFFSCMMLSATLGGGVMLSFAPMVVLEGAFALLAGTLSPLVTEEFLAQLSGTGGAILLSIGLNMLKAADIKTADLLPAVLGAAAVFFF